MKYSFPVIFLFVATALTISQHSSASDQDEKDAGAPTPQSNVTKDKHTSCPSNMVEIEGDFCPNLMTTCLYNVDEYGNKIETPSWHGNPPDKNLWSCGEFKYPTACLSKKSELVHMHYCIDRYEWPNKEGQLPQDWLSWVEAKKVIEESGKRLCTADEWTLAAEGPQRHPLPYGDGYHRDKTLCNFDNHMPTGLDVFKARKSDDEVAQKLRSFLVTSGSKPQCVSDYGVHDMAGNVDEWVLNEKGTAKAAPFISGLKGGHIWHVRNASRPMTDAHGPGFKWYETSSRGCKDITPQ